MELHEALSQISEIRRQMARTAVFRGYRSATAAFSGVVAIAAALTQSVLVPEPAKHVAGALLTLAMVIRMHDEARLLPGLWAILFSLGVFASRRVLPGAISIVGFYYLSVGLVCVAMTDRVPDYSPWIMALIFAPGQF